MKTDIDKLHKLFLNEEGLSGRREGHTTLFAWQLIGIAETKCFSWSEIHEPVWIPFNKPLHHVLGLFETITNICKQHRVDFASNNKKQFVICNTLFEFYQVNDLPFDKQVTPPPGLSYWLSSREDNDAMWREWELTDERASQTIIETIEFTNSYKQ